MARKSNMKGYAVAAALVVAGAWFNDQIFELLHKVGIAKNKK